MACFLRSVDILCQRFLLYTAGLTWCGFVQFTCEKRKNSKIKQIYKMFGNFWIFEEMIGDKQRGGAFMKIQESAEGLFGNHSYFKADKGRGTVD